MQHSQPMQHFLNPHGVLIYVSPSGVLVTFAMDGHTQYDLFFLSPQVITEQLNVASLHQVSPWHLLPFISAV